MLTGMSFGKRTVEETLRIADVPVPRLRRVCSLIAVGMMFAFPTTFRHRVMAYAEREARTLVEVVRKSLPQAATARNPNTVPSDERLSHLGVHP
jgi:hypothetical protein